jgi:iron-sulfur cluster assembly protein
MITLSERASKKVTAYLANRGKGLGIRIGVKTSGCTGFAYVLEFADSLNDHDLVFESNDAKVIVDPKSLVYIDGMEIDYTKKGLNEGFEFINPNVKDSCGCGESFNV